MDEGYPGAARSVPGSLVDKTNPLFLEFREGGLKIVHPEGQMMDPLAFFFR